MDNNDEFEVVHSIEFLETERDSLQLQREAAIAALITARSELGVLWLGVVLRTQKEVVF